MSISRRDFRGAAAAAHLALGRPSDALVAPHAAPLDASGARLVDGASLFTREEQPKGPMTDAIPRR